LIFGFPNAAERRNDYALAIPRGASWLLRHDPDAELQGLADFPDAHPPVAPVFWSFRVMVAVGLLMLGLSWLGGYWLLRRGRLPRGMLRAFAAMTFSGWVATLAGWLTTEIGRQPWLIYGV